MASNATAGLWEPSWMSTLPPVQGRTGEMWTWSEAQPLAVAGHTVSAGGVPLTRADR